MGELVPAHPAHQVLVPHVDNIKYLVVNAIDYAGNRKQFFAGEYQPIPRCHRCGHGATAYFCGPCFAGKKREERGDWFGYLGAKPTHAAEPEGDGWKAVLWVGGILAALVITYAVGWWTP